MISRVLTSVLLSSTCFVLGIAAYIINPDAASTYVLSLKMGMHALATWGTWPVLLNSVVLTILLYKSK